MKIDAFGLVEVHGLVTAIETADAMLKAAHVRLLRQHQVNPGFISLIVEGDLGACRAAVDAGVAAARRLGEVVSRLEIGRPDGDTETMVLSLIGSVPAESGPVAEDKEVDSVVDETTEARTVMFTFIAESPRGRRWSEIVRFFPEYADRRQLLEKMVEEGRLHKKAQRYLRNDDARVENR
ncbi:MAG: BMC domain-containing protein [Candidatus Accumulibacter sp.]|jgi:ethanolamine utilization protein EutK|nr:BMC domain-containing protein [Accumulibacter sp.]